MIRQHIQGKKVLLIFILTTLVYLAMILISIPKLRAYESGMRTLDMMPMGYDMDYVTKLFDALGHEGRQTYRYQQIPLDMIYPSLFAICYGLMLGFFLNKLELLKTPFVYLCLLPFLIGAMDYAENMGIISMLNDYPNLSVHIATATCIFSILKSMGTTIYFVILVGIPILLGFKIRKNESV